MSVYKNPPDGNTEHRNKMGSNQWCARPLELLESPAYKVLSRAAHQVMSRIEIELRHHGGRDNGKLPVTFNDFVEYGLHRHAIAPAIRELEAVGIIRTAHGRAGNAEFRIPNAFFLTYANARDAKKSPPPNDWCKIKTVVEAEQLVRAARAAKDPLVAERGRQTYRAKPAMVRPKKQNKTPVPVSAKSQCRKPSPKPKNPSAGNHHYRASAETVTTIDISGGRAAQVDTSTSPDGKSQNQKPAVPPAAEPAPLVWSTPVVEEIEWSPYWARVLVALEFGWEADGWSEVSD